MTDRPMGERPLDERSDWTEQDLLTVAEATGRLEQEMSATRGALEQATDPYEKELLERRLRAMQASKERLEG